LPYLFMVKGVLQSLQVCGQPSFISFSPIGMLHNSSTRPSSSFSQAQFLGENMLLCDKENI